MNGCISIIAVHSPRLYGIKSIPIHIGQVRTVTVLVETVIGNLLDGLTGVNHHLRRGLLGAPQQQVHHPKTRHLYLHCP